NRVDFLFKSPFKLSALSVNEEISEVIPSACFSNLVIVPLTPCNVSFDALIVLTICTIKYTIAIIMIRTAINKEIVRGLNIFISFNYKVYIIIILPVNYSLQTIFIIVLIYYHFYF